ncbi:Protein containing ALS2cr12 (ALS2CR12) signature [Caenorhabditis elegans]|uniref:Protein containing ALS2cr12 (ALS2CR12) signature n=1 Tax=Caenorhabditis elegans TaxID=6239 RepID=A0A1I6CM88_CAEEL|nr:Protein containing ALS2cr12 (ALS2CR12) signature [Caenorhabditis elegans]SFQ94291.1 Protein containing ALS2cr12 (ALS2CR12) signature [Caenorhabditis elegans]|eukprot:NP_001334220.1 Protein containing ALS2cr12 (ALS2CR12) signature [Caenorhabditis elegans]
MSYPYSNHHSVSSSSGIPFQSDETNYFSSSREPGKEVSSNIPMYSRHQQSAIPSFMEKTISIRDYRPDEKELRVEDYYPRRDVKKFQEVREGNDLDILQSFDDESEYLDKEHSSRIRDLETKKRNCIANFKLKNKKEVEELFAKLINILRIIERELDHNLECEASIHFSDSIEHQIEEFNKQSEYLDRFMLRSNYLDQDFFENISEQIIKIEGIVNDTNLRALCIHFQRAYNNKDTERMELYKRDLKPLRLAVRGMAHASEKLVN